MGRRDEFEDDGRTVADMSDLAGIGLFGRHSAAWQRVSKGDRRDSGRDEGSTEGSLTGKNTREEMPFTWQERIRYIFMALGAAFLIGAVLLGGVAAVIWLFVLYD